MQAKAAAPVTWLPLFLPAGRVAVTVTEVGVEAMQVAVPKVESGALLMVTFTASDTDQVTFERFDVTAAHPEGRSPPNATKRCESPGGGAAWSTVAVGGETLTDPKEHSLEVPQPAIESDRERAKVSCQHFIADHRTPLRNGGIAFVQGRFEKASLKGPRRASSFSVVNRRLHQLRVN